MQIRTQRFEATYIPTTRYNEGEITDNCKFTQEKLQLQREQINTKI